MCSSRIHVHSLFLVTVCFSRRPNFAVRSLQNVGCPDRLRDATLLTQTNLNEMEVHMQCSIFSLTKELHLAWPTLRVNLFLIETPFSTFANRADPDQAALESCLIRVYSVCLWKYDKILSYISGPDK